MKLGYKVGPQKESIDDLNSTKPSFVEVWYNVSQPEHYTELFTKLKQNNIEVGLHFWGALTDGTWTTLAYDDAELLKQSRDLIKKTIDEAHQNQFAYVNIHPGPRAKVLIDFDKQTFTKASEPIELERSYSLVLENLQELTEYAKNKNVVLTLETVPLRVAHPWADKTARNHPTDIYELPVEVNIRAAQAGLFVANDFGHTAANIIGADPRTMWEFVRTTTAALAQQTRLIHIGFVIPAYTGADYHGHLNEPIYETSDAVPNKQQTIELLQLFEKRSDVWVLYEPDGKHVMNYILAKSMLETAKIPFV